MKIGNSLLWVVFFGLHGSSWGASLGTSTNINFVFNLNPLMALNNRLSLYLRLDTEMS